MVRVYIAAPFARKKEALDAQRFLEERGFEVTARWIKGHHLSDSISPELMDLEAGVDLEDICRSQALILLNSPEIVVKREGRGMHFETGYALALGLSIIVVGVPSTVFHYLEGEVQVVPSLIDACDYLNKIPEAHDDPALSNEN